MVSSRLDPSCGECVRDLCRSNEQRKMKKEERKRQAHPKLIQIQTAILILIHHLEDLLHALLRRVLILGQLDHTADHLVDGIDDRQHLLIRDLAVAVEVVQLKGPIQLILHAAARGDGQRADEFLEVDGAGAVAVEDVKHVIGEFGRVAEGEELFVDLLEFGFRERARGAVLEEALVPLLQLLLVEVGGFLQLRELLLRELALAGGEGDG